MESIKFVEANGLSIFYRFTGTYNFMLFVYMQIMITVFLNFSIKMWFVGKGVAMNSMKIETPQVLMIMTPH